MNFRILCILVCVAFTSPCFAACFDTPTWQDEPLTQSYIDSLEDGPANRTRKASLTVLHMARDSAGEQREELKRLLMRTALMQADGDRGALRKSLQKGSLLDVVQLIDFSRSKPSDQAKVVSAYWLNGCVEDAIELLVLSENPLTGQNYMPIATGDYSLISSLAENEEPGEYQQRRLQTFAKLLEEPTANEETLQEFLDYVTTQVKDNDPKSSIDGMGLTLALSLVRGETPELGLPAKRPRPDSAEFYTQGMQFSAFVAWVSVSGYCEAIGKTASVLLSVPAEAMPFNRELLEASAIRCLALQRS